MFNLDIFKLILEIKIYCRERRKLSLQSVFLGEHTLYIFRKQGRIYCWQCKLVIILEKKTFPFSLKFITTSL